jgi:hypothetical protein
VVKSTIQPGVYVFARGNARLLTPDEYKARLAQRAQSAPPTPGPGGAGGDTADTFAHTRPPAAAVSRMIVAVASNPDAADIEIDGRFMGSTPSSIELVPGAHLVILRKSGFRAWERHLELTGGEVQLNATLEKDEPR